VPLPGRWHDGGHVSGLAVDAVTGQRSGCLVDAEVSAAVHRCAVGKLEAHTVQVAVCHEVSVGALDAVSLAADLGRLGGCLVL
jgi:hypothetical protein